METHAHDYKPTFEELIFVQKKQPINYESMKFLQNHPHCQVLHALPARPMRF